MYIGVGVVPTGATEISLYYMEHYRHPTIRLRRGTLRTDGFCSVHASYAGGELLTRPLVFDGAQLVVNLSTSAVGFLKVELQDADGRPLDGYHLADCPQTYGDDISRVVTWRAAPMWPPSPLDRSASAAC